MRYLFFIFFVFFSNLTFSSGGSGDAIILDVNQRECVGDKEFQITLTSDHANPDGCANVRTINLSCDHAAYDTIVSISLAAFLTERKTNFWLNGCDDEGQAKVISAKIK